LIALGSGVDVRAELVDLRLLEEWVVLAKNIGEIADVAGSY
jgi:hypothetical protein